MKSYLKKIILTAVLATVTSLNCSDPDLRRPIHNHHNRTIDPNINMEVGAGTRYRHLKRPVVDRSLDSLAKDAMREDTWMYLRNTLTDVGVIEDSMQAIWNNKEIYSTIKRANPKDTVIMYHIRPDFRPGVQFNPPNIGDIMAHMQIKPSYFDNTKNTNFIGKLFDGKGVWEYDVDDSIAKKAGMSKQNYYDEANRIYGELVRQREHFNRRLPPNMRDTINHNFKSAIDEYIKAMARVGVKLKYTESDSIK